MNKIILILFTLVSTLFAQTTVITLGSSWKYYDQGDVGSTTWMNNSYDDNAWAQGDAELGYGDGDEATEIGFGGDSNDKNPTSYFRKTFNVTQASTYSSIIVNVKYDDGVVIYLNGTEISRQTMPAGTISYSTYASSTFDASIQLNLPATGLVEGSNLLAVEIHQANATSSDISFDLSLEVSTATIADLIRGPYLQLGTDTSIFIKWRTLSNSNSEVKYGLALDSLNSTETVTTLDTEHEVFISGLNPNTKYFYEIYSGDAKLKGDGENHFTTAPTPGTYKNTKVWIIGDAGTANDNQRSVRDAYYTYINNDHTDVWLMLGDNAYDNGTDQEHQNAIFNNMYELMLQKTVTWPTVGNHERYGSTNSATGTGTHFEIWTLPANGEFGGEPSGTEAYYSFDYGKVHFINLNSTTDILNDNGLLTAMKSWLTTDMENTQQDWLIAYFHHPPYTKGSHNSDSEGQLQQVRAEFLPILEQYGIDLVFTGHSHCYERSYLIDNHYGQSNTFAASHQVDAGDGKEDGDGAYTKTMGAHKGAVYFVAGSSGKATGGSLDHNAMQISLNELGSVSLDIQRTKIDVNFVDDQGRIRDYLTLMKSDIDTVVGVMDDIHQTQSENAILGLKINQNKILSVYTDIDEIYSLSILDISGKKLASKNHLTEPNVNFNLHKYPLGKYYLRLKSKSEKVYNKTFLISQ